MPNRFSLYQVQGLTDLKMKCIAGQLREQLFSRRKRSGFLLEKATSQEIKAKHVRRIETEITIEDPLGSRNIKYIATRFSQSIFNIQRETGLLLGLNLAPAFKELTGAMVSSTEAGIIIEGVVEPPEKLTEIILRKLPNARIYGATVTSYRISPDCTAYIRFEGMTDLAKIAKRFLKDQFEFSSFKIQFDLAGETYSCEVKRDRNILLNGDPIDETVKALNEALAFGLP